MSSINFSEKVTQIPGAWANDVDGLVYDVFEGLQTLAAVKTLLGLDKLDDSGIFALTNGSTIDGAAIGETQVCTGRFSSLRVTSTPGTDADMVVTHAQQTARLATLTGALGSLANQNRSAANLTGGKINGVVIGGEAPAAGTFSSLTIPDPVLPSDGVNKRSMDAAFDALPDFGTLATQNANSLTATGGSINGVTVGQDVAAAGAFTQVRSPSVTGSSAKLSLDGTGGVAVLLDGTHESNLDFLARLRAGGTFRVQSGDTTLTFVDGRLALGTDDGVTKLQAGGSVSGTTFLASVLVPTAAGHLTTKKYVDTKVQAIAESVGDTIRQSLGTLGSMAVQNSDAVVIEGGSLDDVVIGGTVRRPAGFTQVSANTVLGEYGVLGFANASGYSNSGLSLTATTEARPNISIVPGLNGVFAVMAGATAVFRTHTSGQTVIGAGGNDKRNKLQVHGDMVVHGRTTFDGGTMTGSVSASFGASAPTLASPVPYWVRVRVVTLDGIKECVMPAFEAA